MVKDSNGRHRAVYLWDAHAIPRKIAEAGTVVGLDKTL